MCEMQENSAYLVFVALLVLALGLLGSIILK